MKKIIIISDTHGLHNKINIPDGDILIHCGDWTNRGTIPEMESFLSWFTNLPQKTKIFIAGNHSVGLDTYPRREKRLALIKSYLARHNNLHYLEHESAIINDIKFFGSPFSPTYSSGWAFNVARGPELAAKWSDIPDDTEILITHGPGYGMLDFVQDAPWNSGRDLHQGCEELTKRIKQLSKLKLHCAGHLHINEGPQTAVVNGITFVNASICNDFHQPINAPVIIDI